MATKTQILIADCSVCHADIADPDYPGQVCVECADEIIWSDGLYAEQPNPSLWRAGFATIIGFVGGVALAAFCIFGVIYGAYWLVQKLVEGVTAWRTW